MADTCSTLPADSRSCSTNRFGIETYRVLRTRRTFTFRAIFHGRGHAGHVPWQVRSGPCSHRPSDDSNPAAHTAYPRGRLLKHTRSTPGPTPRMPSNGVLLPPGAVEAEKHHLRAIPATKHPAACDLAVPRGRSFTSPVRPWPTARDPIGKVHHECIAFRPESEDGDRNGHETGGFSEKRRTDERHFPMACPESCQVGGTCTGYDRVGSVGVRAAAVSGDREFRHIGSSGESGGEWDRGTEARRAASV